jgi:hypothetical protein
MLILLFVAGFGPGAVAQWQIGQQVLSPPLLGNYYALSRGTNYPPCPRLPNAFQDAAVYTVVGNPERYVYDDSGYDYSQEELGQSLAAANDTEGEDTPGSDGPSPGGALFLLLGPTNSNQVWLVLTNTQNGTYYQLESRLQVDGGPWELGEIVQDTGNSNQVQFSNVPRDYSDQRFFQGVGGAAVAFVTLDPDYNLAVEPDSPSGTGQTGKFRVSLNPPPSSSVFVVYQVSGSASNGVDYSSLGGSVTVEANAGSATIEIDPLYDTLPEFDESVTLTLVLTNGYLVKPKYASATMKIYDPRPAEIAVAIHDSGWTKLNGLSSTNWNYFVMPESVKEALRSDGTPFVVLSDLNIANGVLLTTNGTPKYLILISAMQGSSARGTYGYCFLTNSWSDYSVQAEVQFTAGAYGGGVGGRLDPTIGSHYAAWIYPENSPGGSNVLALVRFTGWTNWTCMATQPLASVGTTNHTVKLTFSGARTDVFFDDLGTAKISAADTNSVWYSSGGVSLDMWTGSTGPDYVLSVQHAVVTP